MTAALVILALQLAALASLWAICEAPKPRPALTPEQRHTILVARELQAGFERVATFTVAMVEAMTPTIQKLGQVVADFVAAFTQPEEGQQ